MVKNGDKNRILPSGRGGERESVCLGTLILGVITRRKQKRNPHDENVVTLLAISYKNFNVLKKLICQKTQVQNWNVPRFCFFVAKNWESFQHQSL